MREERRLRIGREIFLAAFGVRLDSFDSWVIDRITSIMEEHDVQEGETLYEEGGAVGFIYFMENGEIRFTRDSGPSWTTRGRWVIGGYEAIGDQPATHTATATRHFRALRVVGTDWMDMLEDSPPLARSAVVNAARTLAALEERVPTLAPTSARAASALPAPSDTLGVAERLALLLDIRMLRLAGVQTIADLAATSQEVSLASGDLIFGSDVGREHLIRIVDGAVVAECAPRSMIRRYGPGDLICGAVILGGVTGAWQARAVAPTRGIAVPLEAVFDLMEEHFDLVRSVFAALGARRQLLLEHLAAESGDLVLT
jgi:CRP-like cAMP-binding protein